LLDSLLQEMKMGFKKESSTQGRKLKYRAPAYYFRIWSLAPLVPMIIKKDFD